MDSIKIPNLKNEQEAKMKAKERLTKIFENKLLNIDTIKNIIADFHRNESQNSIEVFNKIERNISELDISVNKIGQVIQNVEDINEKHLVFLRDWEKITAPLNYYGRNLENLMLSKKNVSIMRHNLDIYVKIKDQVKELKDILKANDNNVVTVFKQVRYLAYLRRALLEKCRTVARSEKLNNLADHLLCVQEFEEEFFQKFWKYFQGITTLAKEKPEFLVKLLRLIEEDPDYLRNINSIFKMYTKSDDKFAGLGDSQSLRESIRDSMLERELVGDSEVLSEILIIKIEEFIDEDVYKRFSDKSNLVEILDETLAMVKELYTIYYYVVPCFPPKYSIFNVYKEKYLKHIYNIIIPFLNETELEKNPGQMIPVAKWLNDFDENLKKVGIDINTTDIVGSVGFCMHLFYDHVHEILETSIRAVLDKNKEDKIALRREKKIDLEKIQSFYATDIFSSMLHVVEPLSGDIKGQLLSQIVKIVIEKLQTIQKSNDVSISQLSNSEDLIVACVYVLDASRCIEIFPDFKKKIKSILEKEHYDRLKARCFSSTISCFNNTIKVGSSKAIELIFIDLEKKFLQNLFTTKWNEQVVLGITGTFREYFNKGFYKILKTQNNLLIIVRSFIDNYVNYYIEELIHSVRSLNRKKLTENSILARYELKYLKINPDEIKYQKRDELPTQGIPPNVKVLDKYVEGKKEERVKFKKYCFPVKKFDKDSKNYNPAFILKRLGDDASLFSEFLDTLKEDAREPFSKYFTQTLGQNYINTFMNKFMGLILILKCHQNNLQESIYAFKECFGKDEGKVILEALLYIREDFKVVTKPDLKKFFLDSFDK